MQTVIISRDLRRLFAVALFAFIVAALYTPGKPAPGEWVAVDSSGDVIASGLTVADCVGRFSDCRKGSE